MKLFIENSFFLFRQLEGQMDCDESSISQRSVEEDWLSSNGLKRRRDKMCEGFFHGGSDLLLVIKKHINQFLYIKFVSQF